MTFPYNLLGINITQSVACHAFYQLSFAKVIYDTLKIAAYSAGYSLGSSNWQIEAGYEKVPHVSNDNLF